MAKAGGGVCKINLPSKHDSSFFHWLKDHFLKKKLLKMPILYPLKSINSSNILMVNDQSSLFLLIYAQHPSEIKH